MHDIDRTQLETELGSPSLEGPALGSEFEGEDHEQELFEQFLADPEQGADHFLGDVVGGLFGEAELEAPLNEAQELELASELLGVGSELEMEQFLGNLFKSAVRGVGNFAKSSAGRAIGGVLKGVAKKALPFAGTALGAAFGGPLGASLGGKLGGAAANLFEMEFEGMSQEDREFEVARKIVRLGASAAKQAAHDLSAGAEPRAAVRNAVAVAARAHAPGLLRRVPVHTQGHPHAGHSLHPGHPMHHAHHHPHGGGHPQHPGHHAHGAQHAHHGQHAHAGHPLHPAHAGHHGHQGQHVHPAHRGHGDSGLAGQGGPGGSGRWVRRGRHIVLLGYGS